MTAHCTEHNRKGENLLIFHKTTSITDKQTESRVAFSTYSTVLNQHNCVNDVQSNSRNRSRLHLLHNPNRMRH